jgi:hypothetical protein
LKSRFLSKRNRNTLLENSLSKKAAESAASALHCDLYAKFFLRDPTRPLRELILNPDSEVAFATLPLWLLW